MRVRFFGPRSSGAARRLTLAASAFVVSAVVLSGAPVAANAAPSRTRAAGLAGVPACPLPGSIDDFGPLDVDGDVRNDSVVGVPTAGAGVIDLRLTRANTVQRVGESAFTGLPPAASGDGFGTAIAEEDVDYNGCQDVIVGAPGSGGTGAVDILFGSEAGLSTTTVVRLVGKTVGERFGSSVVALKGQNGTDVFVGAPYRNVGTAIHAGAVDHYLVYPDGTARLVQTLTQDSPGVAGAPENADHFGSVLAADGKAGEYHATSVAVLTVGVPDEDIGTLADAGMVTTLQFDPTSDLLVHSTSWDQGSAGIPGTTAAGDHFGAALATNENDMFIGIPGDSVGAARGAGAVQKIAINHVASTTSTATFTIGRYFDQNTPGVPGTAETGDNFGAAVVIDEGAAGKCGEYFQGVLEVGSPGEGLGKTTGAGSVTAIPDVSAADATKCPGTLYYQGAGGLGGAYESGDHLGATLSVGFYSNLGGSFLAGVPGEDVGTVKDAGLVVYGPGYRQPPYHLTLHDSAGPRAGEQYGSRPGPFGSYDYQ